AGSAEEASCAAALKETAVPQALIEDRQLQPPTYQLLIKPSKALGKEAQCLDMTVGILNEAGEVHVGHGTYIDVETWERLLQVPMDSTFCKQLAVRLWGNEVLAQRSLTGTLSNPRVIQRFNADISAAVPSEAGVDVR
ncbi:hypothetical protein MTO96_045815, partial [Rhipicephalus appendiculatus]